MYANGKYRAVIRGLQKKASKARLSAEQIVILEKAISQDLKDEEKYLNTNLSSDRFERWKKGFIYLDELVNKQIKYSKIKQVNANNIKFVNIEYWDEAFGDRLYTHHLNEYAELYEKFLETGDKNLAKEAYAQMELVAYFDRSWLNTDSLLSELVVQGRRKFEVQLADKSDSDLDLTELKSNLIFLDNKWSEFAEEGPYDYTIKITLTQLEKENWNTLSQQEYSNVEITGYDAQADENGDVVQVPITETYTALVHETLLYYLVNAEVEVEIFSTEKNKRVAFDSYTAEAVEPKLSVYYLSGDLRAIPTDIDITEGDLNTSIQNFDYTNLVSEVLEKLSKQAKSLVEGY